MVQIIEARGLGGSVTQEQLDEVEKLALEGASTGLLKGGVVSVNDATSVNIASGIGRIVDASDPTDIKYTLVSWAAKSGVSITNVATQPVTFIAIDVSGDVVEYSEFPNNGDLRDSIVIGSAIHAVGSVTAVSNFTSVRPFQIAPTLTDLVDALGVVKLTDPAGLNRLLVDGDPAKNLSIRRGAGKVFFGGIQRNPTEPNTLDTPAATAPSMTQGWRDGAGGFSFANSTTITPGVYDDNTGGAGAPSGVLSNNMWTNHRVYYSPDSDQTGLLYGQNTYLSESAAVQSLSVESFSISPSFLEVPVIAAITIRGGATDLTDPSDAVFTQTNKFGLF